jgi:hypothetical protein
MFDDMIEGADKYITSNSLWIIMTDERRWIIEFTKDKTLWYNFNVFKSEMDLLGMDCIQNKPIIKKWFENRFLNIKDPNHVEYTMSTDMEIIDKDINKVIQNGVKETISWLHRATEDVEDTIENGVKIANASRFPNIDNVDDTIQNGVKRTFPIQSEMESEVKEIVQMHQHRKPMVDDVIQYGVKETSHLDSRPISSVNDAIQNGVKNTKPIGENLKIGVEKAVKQIKEIKHGLLGHINDEQTQATSMEFSDKIDNAIENGVKEIKEIKHNRTTYHGYFNIKDSTHTPMDKVQDVIQNGVKEIQTDLFNPLSYHHKWTINDVIETGVKTISGRRFEREDKVDEILEKGDKL